MKLITLLFFLLCAAVAHGQKWTDYDEATLSGLSDSDIMALVDIDNGTNGKNLKIQLSALRSYATGQVNGRAEGFGQWTYIGTGETLSVGSGQMRSETDNFNTTTAFRFDEQNIVAQTIGPVISALRDGDHLFVQNQAAPAQNGLYELTQAPSNPTSTEILFENLTKVGGGTGTISGNVIVLGLWTKDETGGGGGGSIEPRWAFSTSITSADPGAGNIRFNSATPASVTEVYVNYTDTDSRDWRAWFTALESTGRGHFQVRDDAADFLDFRFNSLTDNTTWGILSITIDDSGTLPAASDDVGLILGFSDGPTNLLEDTTPQLFADLDANGSNVRFDTATGIHDDSDNEQLIFSKTASAVNHFQIANAATGNYPIQEAIGDDTNIDAGFRAKGTGVIRFLSDVVFGDLTITNLFADTFNLNEQASVSNPAAGDGRIYLNSSDNRAHLIVADEGNTDQIFLTDENAREPQVEDGTNAVRLSLDGDRIFHDTNSDGTKDGGEEYIDQAGGGGTTILKAIKTADEIVNNSTTLQDDDHLVIALAANTRYSIKGCLLINGNGTADFECGWTIPASAEVAAGGQAIGSYSTFTDSTSRSITAIAGSTKAFDFVGWVKTGGTAGNLTFQWAQAVADISDTTLEEGSWIEVIAE